MNSDLMPSPESFNPSISDRPATDAVNNAVTNTEPVQTIAADSPTLESSAKLETAAADTSQPESNGNLANRQQPIPPPSEPMQYRAIGLVRGRYIPSSEQLTQGVLMTTDNVELNAVLLGRIMSLVKNHLDLTKEHLWVVYPRTRQETDALHLQIVGVWEPENLAKQAHQNDVSDSISPDLDVDDSLAQTPTLTQVVSPASEIPAPIKPSTEVPDGGFSVRGEVVYQSFDAKNLVVKIKQAPRKPTDKPKYFKLKLQGVLTTKAVGKFWDFNVRRAADILFIENAEAIADLPKKRKPTFKGAPRGGKKSFPPRRAGEAAPRPMKKSGGETSSISKPLPKISSAPKPVKRPKPVQE